MGCHFKESKNRVRVLSQVRKTWVQVQGLPHLDCRKLDKSVSLDPECVHSLIVALSRRLSQERTVPAIWE